jgi:hypothetical protein
LPPNSAGAVSPLRRPFLSQIHTEPSVPPRPAANTIDWGLHHHGPDGLFKHIVILCMCFIVEHGSLLYFSMLFCFSFN